MSETLNQPSASSSDSAISAARAAVESERAAVKEYPGKAPGLVRALQALGDAQREAGDVAGAEVSYREALEAGAKLEMPADVIANVRTNLATLLDRLKFQKGAMDGLVKALPPSSPATTSADS